MSSIAPIYFTGISSYSSDFQTILSRAVSIASLPIKQLQNDQVNLLNRKQLLTELGSTIGELGARIQALGKLGETKAIVATSSNSSKISVTATGAEQATTYHITDVTSLARNAAETSLIGYASSDSTPVSATGVVRLDFGSESREIVLAEGQNNLVGLRNAINGLGLGLTASILTTGTGENPNFLSVSANQPGATTLRLVDNPEGDATELLTASNQGSNTVFKLNGAPVSKNSTFINDVAPGVTFSILQTTDLGETVSLSLATSRSELANGLSQFVAQYNAASQQLEKQVGRQAGLLSGDFLVREAQKYLREVVSYQGGGTGMSLSSMGIEFDANGKMQFNRDQFDSLSESGIGKVFEFLGSSTTGFGELARKLTSISDPVTGMIRLQQEQYDRADLRFQQQIDEMANRINAMQATLSLQLQTADVLLAGLQSQQTLLKASIDSLNFTVYGKKLE